MEINLCEKLSQHKSPITPNHMSIMHPHNQPRNVCTSNQRQQLQSAPSSHCNCTYTYTYTYLCTFSGQCGVCAMCRRNLRQVEEVLFEGRVRRIHFVCNLLIFVTPRARVGHRIQKRLFKLYKTNSKNSSA